MVNMAAPHSINTGVKKRPIPPLKFLGYLTSVNKGKGCLKIYANARCARVQMHAGKKHMRKLARKSVG